jgi:predicted acyl esterase
MEKTLFAQPEPQTAQEKGAEALPATLAGFEDQGKFRIYVNEEPIAETLFSNEKETRFVKAEQTLFHDQKYLSHILLPIIPEDRLK